jgi:hypothetical protein
MSTKTETHFMLYVLLAIACLVVLFFSMKGATMTIFSGKEEEVVLFSPMEGTLTFEGKPVADAKIVRLVRWKDSSGESDTFSTNVNGEFYLPIKKATVRIGPLSEFVMSQSIHVFYNGTETQIWGRSKRSTELYGELGGKPKNFRCDLADEVEYKDVADGLFGTSCKWDSIEKRGEK